MKCLDLYIEYQSTVCRKVFLYSSITTLVTVQMDFNQSLCTIMYYSMNFYFVYLSSRATQKYKHKTHKTEK